MKLPSFLEFWHETWQDWSLAIAGGTVRPVLHLATRGPSLFSNPNPKLAVVGVLRGQMAKIRPLSLCKWGCLYNKSGLSFPFRPSGGEFIYKPEL